MSRLRGVEANVAACFLLNLNLHFAFLAPYSYTGIKGWLLASPLGCSAMLNSDIQGMAVHKYSPFPWHATSSSMHPSPRFLWLRGTVAHPDKRAWREAYATIISLFRC